MYIVLTAFLALNVSSDVLNGFNKVHDGLKRTNVNMAAKNDAQFSYLTMLYNRNPEKVGPWYYKGLELRQHSEILLNSIDSLKTIIAVVADGEAGNPDNLVNLDNLEAASVVMLNPVTRHGTKLRSGIDDYRIMIASIVADSLKKKALNDMLSTENISKSNVGESDVMWEEALFENVPAIAALTHLSKIQNDIREAESEALANIITNVDIGDNRVNQMNPYVIPTSNLVMKGGKYTAQIVMAAVDTTQRPTIFVNGEKLSDPSGYLELGAATPGRHDFSGYIEIKKSNGAVEKRPFTSSFTVMEPMATISPEMMNVLYAGIDNPVSISVPGVPMQSVNATMTNGTLTRKGDKWVAHPSQIDKDAVITVTAIIEGKPMNVGSMNFRVRRLPDPSPFISIKDAQGNPVVYKGSPSRISKSQLLATEELGAAIDDNMLNVSYSVVSFSTVFLDAMGNALPEQSDGANFSPRQKEQIRRLKPGKSFFISNVKAKGPDGIIRSIPPMEVSLN